MSEKIFDSRAFVADCVIELAVLFSDEICFVSLSLFFVSFFITRTHELIFSKIFRNRPRLFIVRDRRNFFFFNILYSSNSI